MRRQSRVRFREFFKCETRDLGHHVVDGRFETSLGLLGDVVLKFPQSEADREFGGDFGDGESCGFAGQRAGAAHSRIHFDYDHFPVFRMDRELDIRSACFHPDLANDRKTCIPHALVFFVGQGLGWRNRDGVSCMHPHRIKVFDGANNDNVVVDIAHDLHLILLPTDDRFLDENLGDRRKGQSVQDQVIEIISIVSNGGSAPAHRKAGTDNAGQTNFRQRLAGFLDRVYDSSFADVHSNLFHRKLECIAGFGFMDHLRIGTDHLALKLLQDAVLC